MVVRIWPVRLVDLLPTTMTRMSGLVRTFSHGDKSSGREGEFGRDGES